MYLFRELEIDCALVQIVKMKFLPLSGCALRLTMCVRTELCWQLKSRFSESFFALTIVLTILLKCHRDAIHEIFSKTKKQKNGIFDFETTIIYGFTNIKISETLKIWKQNKKMENGSVICNLVAVAGGTRGRGRQAGSDHISHRILQKSSYLPPAVCNMYLLLARSV